MELDEGKHRTLIILSLIFLSLISLGSSLNLCDAPGTARALPLPLPLPCSTCEGRCGSVASMSQLHSQCSCDATCTTYGDCCSDFEQFCPQEKQSSDQVKRKVYGTDCRQWRFAATDGSIYTSTALTVNTCHDGTACPVSDDVSNVNIAVPVMDRITGVHYVNARCALCNDRTSLTPWGLALSCTELGNVSTVVRTLQDLKRLLDSGYCVAYFKMAGLSAGRNDTLRYQCVTGVINTCNSTCRNVDLIEKCEGSSVQSHTHTPTDLSLKQQGKVYKNIYCALCQDRDMPRDLRCEAFIQGFPTIPRPIAPRPLPTRSPGTGATGSRGEAGATGATGGRTGGKGGVIIAKSKPCITCSGGSVEPGPVPVAPDYEFIPEFPPAGREGPRGTAGAGGEFGPRGESGTRTDAADDSPLEAFSLSVLLDFNPDLGLTVGVLRPRSSSPLGPVPVRTCDPDHVFVIKEQACRLIACPPSYVRVQRQCVPTRHSVTFNATLDFTSLQEAQLYAGDLANSSSQVVDAFVKIVREKLRDYYYLREKSTNASGEVTNGTSDTNLTSYDYDISASIDYNTDYENTSTVLNIIVELDIDVGSIMDDSNITMFFIEENGLREDLSNVIISGLVALDIDLSRVTIDVNEANTFQGLNSNLTDCRWLKYNSTEYNIDGGELEVKELGRSYDSSRFRVAGDIAFVCVEDSLTQDELDILLPGSASGVLGIVTLVLMVTSMVCLLIRLLLQPIVSSYKTYAGLIQFQLCLALFLAFFSLIISGLTTVFFSSTIGCRVAGAFMYWMFLAAFFWMVTIAVDTWRAFRPSSSFRKVGDDRNSPVLYAYSAFAWLLPALLVGLVIGIDFTNIDPRFKPDLGERLCWFNQRYALLVFFGGPLACCFATSIILYSMIAHYLHKSLANAIHRREGSPKIKIYLRLFAIMGLSWVFGFLAAFIVLDPPYESVLWYIFIGLNASQGIFIFISFVCRKKIFKELCNRLCHRSKESRPYSLSDSTTSAKFNSSNTKSTSLDS